MSEAAKKYGCDLHAYELMTNHVHLLVTPQQDHSIGKMVQSVGRCYVQYFNHSYERTGTLWEGRYKVTLIDTEQCLLTCMRYIELNPVRANNMANHPSEYPWSSYRYHALGEDNEGLTPHREYQRPGKTAADRLAAYRQLFRSHISEKTLEAIREATNKAWVLGSDRFKRRLQKRLDSAVPSTGHGGDRKSEASRKDNQEGVSRQLLQVSSLILALNINREPPGDDTLHNGKDSGSKRFQSGQNTPYAIQSPILALDFRMVCRYVLLCCARCCLTIQNLPDIRPFSAVEWRIFYIPRVWALIDFDVRA